MNNKGILYAAAIWSVFQRYKKIQYSYMNKIPDNGTAIAKFSPWKKEPLHPIKIKLPIIYNIANVGIRYSSLGCTYLVAW